MNKGSRRGFTLVEVMVSILLFSLVMGVTMNLWSQAQRNMAQTTTRQILQHESRLITQMLTADLKAVKANTFKTQAEPLSMEFDRFSSDEKAMEGEKLANERTIAVKYALLKPILHRELAGKGPRTLSGHVEAITVAKKSLSAEEAEANPQQSARVDIAVTLKMRVPGSKKDLFHTERTSVIMRDDYYQLVSKNYASNLQTTSSIKESIDEAEKSNWFDQELTADSLKNLTKDQLDDMNKVQADSIKQANSDLKELDNQIKDIDTGKKWYNYAFGWLTGTDPDVEFATTMRNKLADIECPGENLPEKGQRSSDKADELIKEVDKKIQEDEKEFFGKSFTSIYDENSSKELAASQKKAYEMKLADRQIEKALEKMSEEDKKDPEKMKQFTKLIDQYPKTTDELRAKMTEDLRLSEKSADDRADLEVMINTKCKEMEQVKAEYAKCDLTWMDDSSIEKKVKAYEANKQVYNFGKSKVETLRTKEMSIDNQKVIDEAMANLASTK
ncbi:MAG TPA: prepilin-type N-terminal cleavage/methylation domain-containing protein [Candidatus Ozemobacteraceae bacterium]|nr:prepilin-type N-terminal cleavage/methylation domain-containing protein [Candidatus Ozemobacteraceae bacterium]